MCRTYNEHARPDGRAADRHRVLGRAGGIFRGIGIAVLSFALQGCILRVPRGNEPLEFSRPTVEGIVLQEPPHWHIEVFSDSTFQFVYRDYGHGEFVPGFFIYDRVRARWLQILRLSTEHARLGRSPNLDDVILSVTWDFRSLGAKPYADLPLRTTGSIVFPDRICLDAKWKIYRADFNSDLERDEGLTSFWIRRSDLDAIR